MSWLGSAWRRGEKIDHQWDMYRVSMDCAIDVVEEALHIELASPIQQVSIDCAIDVLQNMKSRMERNKMFLKITSSQFIMIFLLPNYSVIAVTA